MSLDTFIGVLHHAEMSVRNAQNAIARKPGVTYADFDEVTELLNMIVGLQYVQAPTRQRVEHLIGAFTGWPQEVLVDLQRALLHVVLMQSQGDPLDEQEPAN